MVGVCSRTNDHSIDHIIYRDLIRDDIRIGFDKSHDTKTSQEPDSRASVYRVKPAYIWILLKLVYTDRKDRYPPGASYD